ncbi:MAG TPA: flagellar biosynthetic protein FliR [Alphaproteobacteria bacterium]|nr:flagellar biosynthetic protein FliR [Alphaproteobacteria bacterium]
MLAELLTDEVFSFLFVFTRVGAALMLLPGIGDAYVTPRIRLLLGLMITALVLPALMPALPPVPDSPLILFVLVAGEILVGVFIGLIARLMLAALEIAGMVISFQISLANAFVFNPAMTTQGTLVGAFLTILGLVLIFLADLHHLMLAAVVESYDVFPPGGAPPIGDMADLVSRLVAESFLIGVQVSGPFLVIGLIFYLGLGLLNRLMPQVQIFFIAMPLQIVMGIAVMALTVSAMMLFWLNRFQDSLVGFVSS